jgi:hypothetical protein
MVASLDTVAELQDLFDLYHSQRLACASLTWRRHSRRSGYTVTPDDYGFLHIGERHDDSNASNDEASETQTHHTTEKPKPESFRGHTGGE